jgi:hypothetical protein
LGRSIEVGFADRRYGDGHDDGGDRAEGSPDEPKASLVGHGCSPLEVFQRTDCRAVSSSTSATKLRRVRWSMLVRPLLGRAIELALHAPPKLVGPAVKLLLELGEKQLQALRDDSPRVELSSVRGGHAGETPDVMRSSCVQHVARLVEERSELLDFAGFHHVDGIAALRSARLRNGTC